MIVVITGASAGVGRATVRAFARQGADIGLLARGVDGLEGARREVEAQGGRALVLPTDVASADDIEAAAERVERDLGPIDVWVNNAMTSVFSPFKEMTAEEYRRVTEVTYLGQVYGTMAALRRMQPRDRGAIVQVLLVPLTIAAAQAFNFRGLYRMASNSWSMLGGVAIICGTYLLLVLGPRSLASEGGALWLVATEPVQAVAAAGSATAVSS